MKKNIFLILLFISILLIPTSVLAEDICGEKNIEIKTIEIKEKADSIVLKKEPIINNNNIETYNKFFDLGTEIKYKIILKNNSNKDLKIDISSLKNNSKYIKYSLDFENEIIKENEEKEIYLTEKYEKEVESEILLEGSYDEINNLTFNIIEVDKNSKSYFNIYTIIIIILIYGLDIFIFIKLRKKRKINILLLIISLCLIPFGVKASCNYTININSKIEINGLDTTFQRGTVVNAAMKVLSGHKSIDNIENISNKNITAIKYSDVEPNEDLKNNSIIVSIEESSNKIYMWYENGIIYWWSKSKKPKMNEDSSRMFSHLENLTDISGIENFDAKNVKNMNYIFAYNTSISNYKLLKNWNTNNLESLEGAFARNTSLESLDGLQDWDVSNVTSLNATFRYDENLKDVKALKNWDVSKVNNLSSTFSSCINLEEIDLSNWNTKSLTDLSNTFGMWYDNKKPRYDSKLKRIIISNKFDTSKVTTMIETFSNLVLIEDYSFLKLFNTSSVTTLQQIFQCNYNLTDLTVIKDWDVSKVTNMKDTFSFLINLETLKGLEKWNTSSVETLERAFVQDTKLTDISAIKDWNVSSVTNMERVFSNTIDIKNCDIIQNWDVRNVNNFFGFFYGTRGVNLPIFNSKKGYWNYDGTYITN